jgi:murein DD-endopeptidase MepM/ murein hydrolase activator NlpD
VAGYTALIDLRVGGLDGLKKATDSLASINNLIKQIKPVPTLFDQRTGGGTEKERAAIQAAKTALSGLVKAYADGNTRVAKFSTSMAGLSNQMRYFNTVAGNAQVGSEEFVDALVAAERASRKLTDAEYDRLKVLRNIYTAEKTGGRTTTTAAEEVLKRGRKVLSPDTSGLKSSIAELELYQAEIETVFETVSQGTPVFRELQQALAAVNKELTVARGMGAMQGPALPGGFTEQGARSGTFPSSPIRGGVGMKGSPLAKDAQRKMLENVLIGGGFPMLFGGGAGAVLGGAAGGLIPGNPMLSIVTSALGTVVDQFAAAATEMGASLRDPITNFEKLKEANLFASKTQEFYIQKLIETGRITEATGAIQAQIIQKVGIAGYNDLTKLADASTRLTKELAGITAQAQALTAGPLSGILSFLTDMLKLGNEFVKLNADTLGPLFGLLFGTGDKKPTTPPPVKIDPATQEQAIKAAEQVADTIKGAYRTGFQLQQQALDLQRQGTDLQRRVADDIFNKQQQIARLQIDNERQRQQIAIETVDLEYRRRISQEEGRVAEALAAEADLLKTRAQGEATIENAKRLLELDITKQRRDTENYVYQLGREIENIRRSTLNYEMQVADYRLDVERKVAAERRIENAGTASGSVPAAVSGGKAGVTATSVAGFPITSRQGMRTHPVTGGQKMHAGTDIGTPMNTALAYSLGGVVTKATTMGGYGKILEVKLDNGVTAFAAHLNDVLVKAGEKFKPNQLLARTGQTGVGTGPHLHMEGTQGGDSTAPLPYLVLGGKKSKVNASPAASTTAQLTTAKSQVTARPAVPTVDAAGAGATLANLNATDAAIRKEAVTLQEKLNQLQESAALQRLEEVARGPIDLQQRRDALDYAKADLSVVQVGNSELQERLAFEAQSLVKLQIRVDRDKEILENTKLQGGERKKLEDALQKGLEITQQQILLDREALRLAQEKRFAVEEANIQSQLGVTGTGLKAGFIGPAAGAFESEMLKSGNTEDATRLAELTNQLTLAQVQAQGMESSVLAIGDAFGTAMTSGVASLIDGTATAEQVFAEFLNTIAQALLKAAAQMIATYIAIAIAKAIAGMSGGTQAAGSAAGPKAFGPGGPKFNPGAFKMPKLAANGATFANGIATFAKGGTFSNSVVSSPTMFKFADGGTTRTGLMGEAGPEAIMPLKRGADGSLGVQANGLREAMGRPPGGSSGSPVLNMSFQSTNINGVEYVSRDQLEAAMAQTRRQAAKDGASRGMNMTLDKIQNSPSTRSRVGIR